MMNDFSTTNWIDTNDNILTYNSATSNLTNDVFTCDDTGTTHNLTFYYPWPDPRPDYYEWPKGVWCPTDKEYHPEWHIKKSYKLQVERMWI